MATPPTFIADNEATAGWDTDPSSLTTAAFNSAVGDVWVTGGVKEGNTGTLATPTNTGTAQTFTVRGAVDSANYTEVRAWTTVVANTLTSQTVTMEDDSSNKYGFSVLRFSGSAGIGAVPSGEAETDNTAPSLSITTTGDNSAIVVFMGDWDAIDGASRTWRTVNSITPTSGNGLETTYFRNSSNYAVYVGYYSDAGAAGAKTVGLTAPTTGKFSIVAVEVLGSASTNATVTATTVAAVAAQPVPAKQTGSTVAATVVATVAALPAPTVSGNSTVTATAVAATAAMPAPAVQTGSVVAANAIITTIALPPPALQTDQTVTATAITTTAALPAPTVSGNALVAATAIVATAALPAPAVQTGSVVAATTIAATTALPAPTVSTAGNATVEPAAIATVAALPAPAIQTGQTVTAVAVAAVTALPAPTVDTGGAGTYVRHVTLAATRNGTTAHAVHPDGTGGSVVDGSAFTPVAGRFLICVVNASVTSTTPTGWTLPTNGSAIDNTGLYVFYRATATGDADDGVATTHNVSNFPAVFDFYEFAAGSAWVDAATAVSVNANGGQGPTLSGLTGTNWTAGALGQTNANAGLDSFTWAAGTEEVDTSEGASGTDGYTYSLTYTAGNTSATASYAATGTETGVSVERLVFAIDAAVSGDVTVPATAVAAVAAVPAATISTGSTVTATTVAAVAALPAPTVQTAGNVTVNPATVAAVAALPAPSVSVGVTVTPDAVAAVVDIPGIEQADATVAPAAVAATAALPAPAVQTAGNATVPATAIAAAAGLPAPSVSTGSRVSPATIVGVTVLPLPTGIGSPVGIQGNAYPPSGAATGSVYPRSDGGIIGSVA